MLLNSANKEEDINQYNPGSLFILVDNKNNHVIKAKYVPAKQDIVTEEIKAVSECFVILDSAYEQFKTSCCKDEKLKKIKDACILRINIENTNDYSLPDLASPLYIEEHLCVLNKYLASIAHLPEERKKWANQIYKNEIAPQISKNFKDFPGLIQKYSQYPEIIHLMAAGFLLNHPAKFSSIDQEFLREIRQTEIYKKNKIDEKCDPCKLNHITHLEIVINYIAQNEKRYSELCCLYHAQIGNHFKYCGVRPQIITKQMELLVNKYYSDLPYAFQMPLEIKKAINKFLGTDHLPASSLEEKLIQQLKLFIQLSDINRTSHFKKSKERSDVYMQLAQSRIEYLNEYLIQKGYFPGLQQQIEDLKTFMSYIPINHTLNQNKLFHDLRLISGHVPYCIEKYILFGLECRMEALKHTGTLNRLQQNNQVKCIFSGLTKEITSDFSPKPNIPAAVILNSLSTLSLNTNYNYPLFNITFQVNSNLLKSNASYISMFCQNLMKNICNKDIPFIVYATTKDQTARISILSSNIAEDKTPIMSQFSTFLIEREMKALMWSFRLPVLSLNATPKEIKENLNQFLTDRTNQLLPPSKRNCKRT